MAEALRQLKRALGDDAIILHTRTYCRRRWLGLKRQEVVEITAGRDADLPARGGRRTAAREPKNAPTPLQMKSLPAAAMPAAPAGRSLLQTPAASSAVMMGLSQEMGLIKSMVMDLVKETRSAQAPQVPEELFDHYLGLIQNQVARELAADIVAKLHSQLRPEHLKNGEFVRSKLAEHVERMLPAAGPIVRTKTAGPHVVALIGPTGVGKTTTIAKLAANLKLREKRRVGLITIDTYRIAAVDQLKKYADIIGSPLKVVSTPDDLREAISAMSDFEFILIDTAGRSPTDALKLSELRNFIVVANPDEVHLVLSTTASQECIESAIARFGEVRVDKIIFTKLDEAVHIGVVLNVIRKVNKRLSYLTTGQDVPDDIEVVAAGKLARLILGGNAEGGGR